MTVHAATGGSAISIALQGIHKGLESVAKNAETIAGFGLSDEATTDDSILNAIVDLKQDVRQIEALRKVITTTSEMEDEALRIIA